MLAAALLDWFEPEELANCAQCGEQAALVLPASGTTICFACGFIVFPGGITTVSAIQGREPGLADELAARAAERGLGDAKRHGVDLLYRSGDTHHLS
jgi:3-polyprenyl-4-hydroxybenzoate decarboxylase